MNTPKKLLTTNAFLCASVANTLKNSLSFMYSSSFLFLTYYKLLPFSGADSPGKTNPMHAISLWIECCL